MEEQFYKEVLDRLHSAVYVRDRNRNIIYMNRKARFLSNSLSEDGKSSSLCYELFGGDSLCHLDCLVEKEVLNGRPLKDFERTVKTKDGQIAILEVSATPYILKSAISGAIIIIKDVTEEKREENSRKNTEVMNSSLNIYDELTQEYNRNYFLERLGSEFMTAQRHSIPLSLLVIEPDISPTTMDDAEQEHLSFLIRRIVETVRGRVRRSDLIFRFSERRVSVVLQHARLEAALTIAEELAAKISNSSLAEGKQYTVSIGLAELTDRVTSSHELIELSLSGLAAAQESGGGVRAIQNR